MSFYTYILRCSDGSYYAGHADELEKRIAAHHMGAIPGYTSGRRPVRLVFTEEFFSREEAFQRERQIKGWTRRMKEALIRGDWSSLRQLSKARGSTGSP
ncbi:MAG: GIY-YIG nuclease family protein [Chloroflexi bacterium]|nr:GIY-YIG nuclease family protein [Chloroflexota bacterium]